jgi:hypothetical protein
MTRFTSDVTNQLGAFDTRCLPDYSSVTPTDPAAMPTTPTDPAAMPTDPAAMPTAPAAVPNAAPPDAVRFNFGVIGKGDALTLSVYRVEKPAAGATPAELSSDLRCVNYWLVMNGSDVIGLARREVKLATSADIDMEPSEIAEQEKYIIAREVKGIQIQYFDGVGEWKDSWDGTEPASVEDGTPIGPPAAIKITVTLRRQVNPMLTFGAEVTPPDLTYTHVIALPAANNFTKKAASTSP